MNEGFYEVFYYLFGGGLTVSLLAWIFVQMHKKINTITREIGEIKLAYVSQRQFERWQDQVRQDMDKIQHSIQSVEDKIDSIKDMLSRKD